MVQIKLHAKRFSHGLKSRLAVLVVAVIAVVMSSTFTFAGLYLYSQARHSNTAPASISQTAKPNKISSSTKVKNPGTASTSQSTSTSAPKPVAPVEPVVVVQPVAPAPSSSVESLTSATTPSAPVVSTPSSSASANPIRVSTTEYRSTNWSGYLATGGNFSTVSGSWVVPSVTGPIGIESGDGSWIGIGGVTSGDLIQTGTLHFVNPDGSKVYGVFYEILPASATIITMSVSPGDLISASITETSLNQWLVSISNLTTGNNFSTNLSYVSLHSSAEWVEEDPSYSSGGQVPFANFGTVTFSGCNSTVDSYLYNIADIGASPITMLASGSPVATPSVISGSGFSVVRN